MSGVNGNVLGGVSMERAERFVDKARVGRDRLQKAAMRPTQAHVARQLGDLMKVDF